MSKIYYNQQLLDEYCKNNCIKLNNNYNDIIINRETKIDGNCIKENCYNTFIKSFRYMIKYGGFCKKCTTIKQQINMKETNLKKHGVENPFQSEIFKEKIKETNLKKYGVENPNYSEEIIQQKKKKCFEKYGVNYTVQLESIIEKRKQVCLEKYGVEYPFQSEEYRNKFKDMCFKKYGVENPQQNPEIAEKTAKNSYRRKTYILPSGKEMLCQGYEPFALDKLIKEENILEEDIITGCKNVPTIWYEDESGKKHRHYVDIFIPNQNRCIEVKSTWTAEKNNDNIYLKQEAAKQLGYKYEIWIYNSKKQLTKIDGSLSS